MKAAFAAPWGRDGVAGIRRRSGGAYTQTAVICALCVAGAVVVGLSGFQSRHSFTHAAVPILLAPVVLWMFLSERYAVTLAVFVLYLGLADGFLKLSSGSQIATLGRDILLYAMTLGAVVRVIVRKTPLEIPRYAGFAFAWTGVCVMQVANPSDLSVSHSLSALRPHLEFVPLFFFGYVALRTQRRLNALLLILAIIGAANGAVSLFQTHLTPSQLASWGPGYATLELGGPGRVARVFVSAAGMAQVRPPGLGGTDGFGGIAALIALPACLALLTGIRRVFKLSWLILPATALTIIGIVTSQTRLAVVAAVIALVAFLALTLTSRRGLIALALTAIIGVGGYITLASFTASNATRYSSIAPTQLLNTVISSRRATLAKIPHYFSSYPLGAGMGLVGPAGSTLSTSTAKHDLDGESEMTFLLIETGIPGLLVMLAFSLAMIRVGFRLRRLADPGLQRPLMALAAVLIALLAAWVIGPVTAASPTAPFIWLSAGCLAYWFSEMRAGRVPIRSARIRQALAGR